MMSQQMGPEDVSGAMASGQAEGGGTASNDTAKRPRTPEPCTSSAASGSSAALGTTRPKPRRFSVYSHIEGIEQIGQLRGLRSGRRRSRFRATQRGSVTNNRYADIIEELEPIFQKDMRRLEEAQALVAAAIDHFANAVSSLAHQLEMQEHEIEIMGTDKYLTSVIA